ncbi:zinc finger protein 420 isoform X2 [Polypterus senegalus]|uniref:zinc finger protein 420 isoform X2 n=1 Tax=Polypterus senegalus TaxID=55291 RepID=UPI00196350B3|nr:zinc finger protein 420 isoform X2 [Polypterus senegalus]
MAESEGGISPSSVYIQHQYMCSECGQLFNMLEEVLIHQQSHFAGAEVYEDGASGEAEDLEEENGPLMEEENTEGVEQVQIAGLAGVHESHYQCLECGQLLMSPDELLQHQELHMKDAIASQVEGLDEAAQSHANSSIGETQQSTQQIHYQCLECQALFDSPDMWLAHRQTHTKPQQQKVVGSAENPSASTDSAPQHQEILVQTDGPGGPFFNLQNLVLSEHRYERAGEILSLAQVLATQQQTGTVQLQICSAPGGESRGLLLSSQTFSKSAGSSAISAATPLAVEQTSGSVIALSDSEHSYQRATVGTCLDEDDEPVQIHPYECSECGALFQTPEEFLEHQGAHFLEADKESGETVMPPELNGQAEEEDEEEDESVIVVTESGTGIMVLDSSSKRGSSAFHEVLSRQNAHRSPYHRCSDCKLDFSSAEELRRHRRIDHMREEFRCPECQRLFTSANRLAAHRKVHIDGTHECPECSKVFKKAASLEQHARVHSGEALYLCVDCGLGFATEMTLIVHRKTHTPEPLHRCQYCAKTFTNMTKYLYHRRTHSGKSGTPAVVPQPAYNPVSSVAQIPVRRTVTQLLQPPRVALPDGSTDCQQTKEEASRTESVNAVYTEGATIESSCSQLSPGKPEESQECLVSVPVTLENGNAAVNGVLHGSPDVVPEGDQNASNPPGTEGLASTTGEDVPKAEESYPCPLCPKSFPTQIRLVRHKRTVHISERKFKCNICGMSFKKQVHVKNHLRTHTGERPYQCSECGKTFSSLANLTRHNFTHTGQRPYTCEVCQKTFTQSSNLQQHRLSHSSTAPFSCSECGATFTRPSKLAAHRYQHTGELPYKCSECDRSFLKKRLLELHKLSHQGKEPYHCDKCGIIFANPSKLSEHQCTSSQSVVKQSFECTVCGKRLNSPANLRLHELAHSGVRPFKCSQCPKGFTNKGSLNLHERRHWGLSPHKCAQCGKSFVSASGLALHQRIHTGERPYPCTECGKRFRQATHLREHLRTHSGERPFQCEICQKCFVQSMHLAEHRRTHTGERPHQCPDCGKAFKTFSNLRCHRKTHGKQKGNLPPETQQHIQLQVQQPQSQTPTIMCTEFGDTIAIIETSDSSIPIVETIEIYQAAIESSLQLDNITVENMQLDNIQVNTIM